MNHRGVADVAVVETELGVRVQMNAFSALWREWAAIDDLDRFAGYGIVENDVTIGVGRRVHAICDEIASAF